MITTYHYSDFRSLSEIAELKERHHDTISVILPALNEAATIGPIVETINRFKSSSGIIDEIIVMDDASDDATAQTARDAGATVYPVEKILPSVTVRGKGTALWKAQFIAGGSILVFIDADLLEFDERFIVGPAGALLRNRRLELVKSSYRRHLTNGPEVVTDNGGRVTELLLRPLLNLFIPDLAPLNQPLAGEYAVRRASLGQIPFFSGYGVETGLLLDYYFTHGIKSIGQVNVGTRTHRNRTLSELSRMSCEIAQVFFELLEKRNYCIPRRPERTITADGQPDISGLNEIHDVRLPPRNSLSEVSIYGS
jgi:glycosyltransferase involved in cell wall biosynthesis